MKYFVLEIQKSADGNVATLTTTYDDKEHAEAGFYSLLAVCALSSLPKHGAMLITENGAVLKTEIYIRPNPKA